MGKRGQVKKACERCARRKIRCDANQRQIDGFNICSPCQRGKHICSMSILIGAPNIDNHSLIENEQIQQESTELTLSQIWKELNINLPFWQSSPKDSIPSLNSNQTSPYSINEEIQLRRTQTISSSGQSHDNYIESNSDLSNSFSPLYSSGVLALDQSIIKRCIFAFFNSKMLLARILQTWKQTILQVLPTFTDTNHPFIFLLEAIVCCAIPLDPQFAISLRKERVDLVNHLKDSIDCTLYNPSITSSLSRTEADAILASCAILLDVWDDVKEDCLFKELPEKPQLIHYISPVRIDVTGIECLSRILEQLIFSSKHSNSFDSTREIDNSLLYKYIFIVDAFDASDCGRKPFLDEDFFSPILQSDLKISRNDINITSSTGASNWLSEVLRLASIARQIGILGKMIESGLGSPKSRLKDILKDLQAWRFGEDERIFSNSNASEEIIQGQMSSKDPMQFCAYLLHKYCFIKLHVLMHLCQIHKSDLIEDQITEKTLTLATLSSWNDVIRMLEKFENDKSFDLTYSSVPSSSSSRVNSTHILFSQSRIMINIVLGCIEWGLQRITERNNSLIIEKLSNGEMDALMKGSTQMLQSVKRFVQGQQLPSTETSGRIKALVNLAESAKSYKYSTPLFIPAF